MITPGRAIRPNLLQLDWATVTVLLLIPLRRTFENSLALYQEAPIAEAGVELE
jgi:hypothetical protein